MSSPDMVGYVTTHHSEHPEQAALGRKEGLLVGPTAGLSMPSP